MIWIAIVDDDPEVRSSLNDYFLRLASEIQEELNIAQFPSGKQFLEQEKNSYDLVCLDIDMPDINGMMTAQRLRDRGDRTEIVFVTNLAHMAIQGYRVHALDFIVKPTTYSSFALKMKSILQLISGRKNISMVILTSDGMRKISSDQLYYAEINGHYLCYHTTEGDYRQKSSLTQLQDQLDGLPFMLCNQCYLVNLKYVSEIKKDEVLVGSDWLKISRPRRKRFMEALVNYIGGTGNV